MKLRPRALSAAASTLAAAFLAYAAWTYQQTLSDDSLAYARTRDEVQHLTRTHLTHDRTTTVTSSAVVDLDTRAGTATVIATTTAARDATDRNRIEATLSRTGSGGWKVTGIRKGRDLR